MLNSLLETWSSLYANSSSLRTGIEFLHIGGLLAGGGCAMAADLLTLAAGETEAAQLARLALLQRAHRVVVAGLGSLVLSGLLLLAADFDEFWYSRVFWLKMGLIVVLLANGAMLQRGDRRTQTGGTYPWVSRRRAALASLILWFATTLAGVALLNLG